MNSLTSPRQNVGSHKGKPARAAIRAAGAHIGVLLLAAQSGLRFAV